MPFEPEPQVEEDRLRDDDDPDELLEEVERGLFLPRDFCRRRERLDGEGERLRESERDTEDDESLLLLLDFLLLVVGLECFDFETDFEGGDFFVVDSPRCSPLEGLCLDSFAPRLSLVFVVPGLLADSDRCNFSFFLLVPSPPSFVIGLAFFFVSFFTLLFSILRLRLRLLDSLFLSDCFLLPPLLF